MKNYIILALLILTNYSIFAQENPYEVFGHESKVKYETKISEYLTVKNTDTNSATKSMVFNMDEGVILFLGNNDTIIKSVIIQPEQLLRFLSVDPLTKDYPWYTPYQFAGNKPIMAIDLDGLEEYVKIYMWDSEKANYNYLKTINYNDIYPGEKYGPLGKSGTASVRFNTFANDKKSYSEANIQISYLDNNNNRITKEGVMNFDKNLSAFTKLGNALQGSDWGDPGSSKPLTKQDFAVTGTVLANMLSLGTAEGVTAVVAAIFFGFNSTSGAIRGDGTTPAGDAINSTFNTSNGENFVNAASITTSGFNYINATKGINNINNVEKAIPFVLGRASDGISIGQSSANIVNDLKENKKK